MSHPLDRSGNWICGGRIPIPMDDFPSKIIRNGGVTVVAASLGQIPLPVGQIPLPASLIPFPAGQIPWLAGQITLRAGQIP